MILLIIVVGFALAFHILLTHLDEFSTPGNSMLKTLIMMSGEFDYGDIFFAEDEETIGYIENENIVITTTTERVFESKIYFKFLFSNEKIPLPFVNITYALFVIFFFLLSIVSLNLLVGLTVDDIKEFLDEAEFKNLKLKLTFVLGIEKLYYSRYLLYTKFFLRYMNQQKFKLVHRTNRVYNNDVVSKQRIWQLILQKGIDDIKKVIFTSTI